MRSIYNIREQINSIRLHLIHSRRKNRIGQQIDPEKIAHLEKRIECKSRWYGNSYGGFYIIPGLLNESSIIYSIGIGKDISFDKACIKKHNCTVFAFDPTPKSIEWIRKQKVNGKFHFFDYGISPSQSGHHDFFLPANPRAVSGSILIQKEVDMQKPIKVMLKTFEDITRDLNHTHIDVLKMDIEGAEYAVLESILETSVTIDQLLVEFHDRIFDASEYKSKEIVNRLKGKGYSIFGTSVSYEEVSFIHESILKNTERK